MTTKNGITIDQIRDLGQHCDELRQEWEEAKATALQSKHAYESELKKLLVLTGAEAEDTPLADRGEPDGWRRTKLADLLPKATMSRLKPKGWKTLGQLAKWAEKKPMTEIDGVGESTAKAIWDEIDALVKTNKDWLANFKSIGFVR